MSTQHSEPIRTFSVQARPLTEQEAQRRRRRNAREGIPGGAPAVAWVTSRNGLPWKPYRYRGSGVDAFTGEAG